MSRSKMRAASFDFIFSYIETMLLNFVSLHFVARSHRRIDTALGILEFRDLVPNVFRRLSAGFRAFPFRDCVCRVLAGGSRRSWETATRFGREDRRAGDL